MARASGGEMRFAGMVDAEIGDPQDVPSRSLIYDAHHEVSVDVPAPFADDVNAWLGAFEIP